MKCNEEVIKDLWQNNIIKNKETMHLYFHVPFCVNICKYCMYKSVDLVEAGKETFDNYFENLIDQVNRYKDILEGKPIDSIYIGGGTPSLIPMGKLKELIESIPNHERIGTKVFEANPISTTKNKIDTLKDLGFTYITFGVQTLDKEELVIQNRKPVDEKHLKEITEHALKMGMHVNYDIMCLLNDDLEKDMDRLYQDLEKIMTEFKPPSIDVYPMDQKLNDISQQEILNKIKTLRKTLKKSIFLNDEYHSSGGMSGLNVNDDMEILKTYKDNYHILNISDEEFYGKRKKYSCSGPQTAPIRQNVLSFGGFDKLSTYSYSANRTFIYYSKIGSDGQVEYDLRKS